MIELDFFPECDGHIESILIGYRNAKVSFQTWDSRKLVLIYDDVVSIKEQSSVFGDIAVYTETKSESGLVEYVFRDADDNLVLYLLAGSIKIFEVGNGADINSALFDVGYDFIGNQHPQC